MPTRKRMRLNPVLTNKLFKMIEGEFNDHDKYKRYSEAMMEIGEEDVALVFSDIAEMELKHALWLKKVYQYFGGH